MKVIFLFLIILSGAIARAQQAGSQASQVITLRLQPVSVIDLSAVHKQATHTDSLPANSSMREVVINKGFSADTHALQNEKDSYQNMMAYNAAQPRRMYTFSSK